MSFKINWLLLISEMLQLAPQIITDVEADNYGASHETKTELAKQTLVQASTLAQQIDPKDAEVTQAVTAVAGGIITAVKMPSPVPPTAG